MNIVYIDFETRSRVNIMRCGAGKYAMDPSTEILMTGYAVDDGPVKVHFGSTTPAIVAMLAKDPANVFCAQNAFFEYFIWMNKWSIPVPRFKCTRAKLGAHGLPQKLELGARALKLGEEKDIEGKRLIGKFSVPRPDGEFNELNDFPDEKKAFGAYCAKDVIVERLIDKRLNDLTPFEQELFDLTQQMNARGIAIDRKLAQTADEIGQKLVKHCNDRLKELTHDKFHSIGQTVRLKQYLNEKYKLDLPDMSADTIDEHLNSVKDPVAREILVLRTEFGRTSISKFAKMCEAVCDDDRIRDYVIYHGAHTGRWTSQLVQLHNLPRGGDSNPNYAIDILKQGDSEFFERMYEFPISTLSSCIRGALLPSKGKKMFVADYNAIEARVLMWLADQKDAVQMFRDGEDIYLDMARSIYHDPDLTKANKQERQLGKQVILGCVAEGTLIYSDSGYIPIEQINRGQRVWDGEHWVNFQGQVNVGKKNVTQIEDLEVTLDHLIFTNQGWQSAAEIVLSGDTKHLHWGQNSVTGQLLDPNLKKVQNVASLSAVNAHLNKVSGSILSGEEKQPCVIGVPKPLTASEGVVKVNTLTSFLTHVYEKNGLSVGGIFPDDVKIPITRTSNGMVLEAFPWVLSHAENLWNMLLRSLCSITGGTHSIELIMPKGTSKEICESLLKESTIKTKVRECFDLIDCDYGRFQAGNFILHNCGFQMGPAKFKVTCAGYGIDIDEEFAKTAVYGYRNKYTRVVQYWEDVERAAMAAVRTGKPYRIGHVVFFMQRGFLKCRLPSGRDLAYYGPKIEERDTKVGRKHQLGYHALNSQINVFGPTWTYGGKLTENIVQAVARDIMGTAKLKLNKEGYVILLSTHDEIICEADPRAKIQHMIDIMCDLPEWADGCPITAEGWVGDRYRK